MGEGYSYTRLPAPARRAKRAILRWLSLKVAASRALKPAGASGHWEERLSAWEAPEGVLENKQFMTVLAGCLEGLPAKTARAFMMREHLGLETPEICKALDITPTHCWVLLYRARMALRLCLNERWFAGAEKRG